MVFMATILIVLVVFCVGFWMGGDVERNRNR